MVQGESGGFCLASDRSLLNSRRVPKWVKTLIAVLLLPLSIGATRALVRVLRDSGGADAVWVAMLAGAAFWLAVFLPLPKPHAGFVFRPEPTPALWTTAFGRGGKEVQAASHK